MEKALNERFLAVKRRLFSCYYSNLNDKQQEAVYTVNGPLLVIAGAGSGKTTVLVNRIAHIINYGDAYYTNEIPVNITENDVGAFEMVAANASQIGKQAIGDLLKKIAYNPCKPYEILTFTFTNKAAGEMKERLSNLLGDVALDIWAGTFHSICVRILRRHITLLGYESGFTIYDTEDSKKLILNCVKALELDPDSFNPKNILNIISKCKNKFVTPEELEAQFGAKQTSDTYRISKIAEVYASYQKALKSANAVDFDDIIALTIKLFEENEDILEMYSSKFKYVLVDEYQDTNMAQYRLMSLLCSKYSNVMVVGDDDQSIYKFRGATIENILKFDKEFNKAKVVLLEQNYRSTSVILDAANAVIKNNEERRGKTLWTGNGRGDKIEIRQLENQETEARYIVEKIHELVASGAYKHKDIAVLYRMNALSNSIESTMARAAVPHRLLGGQRFYDRKEIKDIVAYLCIINNPNDIIKLERVINCPKRGIGDATVALLKELSEKKDIPIFDLIKNADLYPELSKSASKLKKFAVLIESLKDDSLTLEQTVRAAMERSGYLEMLTLAGESETDRIENLNELLSNAIKYANDNENATLNGFLEDIALVSDIDSYDADSDAVVLMTMHSSKGLEFPVVFIAGMEENVFPSAMSASSSSELEEERRLFYVAITRARKKLYMTASRERLVFGKTNYNKISPFAEEIPSDLVECHMPTQQRVKYNSYQSSTVQNVPISSTSIHSATKKSSAKEFSVGDSVTHAVFGKGKILEKKPMGSDILYIVEFEKVGTKKLMGNYAKLK